MRVQWCESTIAKCSEQRASDLPEAEAAAAAAAAAADELPELDAAAAADEAALPAAAAAAAAAEDEPDRQTRGLFMAQQIEPTTWHGRLS